MQRNCVKKYVSNTEKNAANKDLIYQHMSSHYRRIINAKKIVDTSPPSCYKPKRSKNSIVGSTESIRSSKSKQNFNSRNISPVLTQRSVSTNSYKGSCWGTESGVGSSRYHAGCVPQTIKTHGGTKYVCFDMGLVDLITYDTKNSPEVYCNGNWQEIKEQHNNSQFKLSTEGNKEKSTLQPGKNFKPEYQRKKIESKEKRKFPIRDKQPPKDLNVKHNQFFTSLKSNNKEKIYKTTAVSKLRSLNVYYPPRKRQIGISNKSSPEISIGSSPKTPKGKLANIQKYAVKDANINLQKNISAAKEQSQTSSRDSAYNGGVSSLPESRSPTPDQRLVEEKYFSVQEDQDCFHSNRNNHQLNKINGGKKAENFTQKNDKNFRESLDCNLHNEKALKKMKEDGLYIKFIQDITVEILEKCLYTNKSLKKVMRRHILANLENLNKERMIKEVENLRIQLGIPEDKAIFDIEKEVIDSFSDLASPYSFISDSEFILPDDLRISKKLEVNQIKNIETDEGDTENSKSTINCETAPNRDKDQPHQIHQLKDEKIYKSFSLESGCDEDDDLLSYIQDITKNKKKKNIKTPVADCSSITSSSDDESIKSPLKTKRSKLRGKSAKDRQLERNSTSSSDIEENILEDLPDEASCENEVETKNSLEKFRLKETPTDESSNADMFKSCECAATLKKYEDPCCCSNCVEVQENITHRKIKATFETTITKSLPK